MARKKKKKGKKAKNKGLQFQNLNPAQISLQGSQLIENGKARDAIELFKFAIKKHGLSKEFVTHIFDAYMLRSSQLRDKGMLNEAEAVMGQAKNYMPQIETMTQDQICHYISGCSDQDAFDLYLKYKAVSDNASQVEQMLSYRMFERGCWSMLKQLDESNPVRQGAEAAETAYDLMKKGEWEKAATAFGSVSRKSPYASMRIFCRAMSSFYAKKDKDALKGFTMLPDDFPLKNVTDKLKSFLSKNGQASVIKKSVDRAKLHRIIDSPDNARRFIKPLIDNLEMGNLKNAAVQIRQMAGAVYSDDPKTAVTFILESIWPLTHDSTISISEFGKLAMSLIDKQKVEFMLARAKFLDAFDPVDSAGEIISRLKDEFKDKEAYGIAYGLTIQNLVKIIQESRSPISRLSGTRNMGRHAILLGIESNDSQDIMIDLAAKIVEVDPLNRKGYELISEFPRYSRHAKNKVETVLTAMTKKFEDDPFPYLELASLYYEKNAFRKAEKILDKAMKKAPHDNRVLERHILSFLISAEKGFARKKYHLVETDLSKAEKFQNKKLFPFIVAKQILLEHVKGDINLLEELKRPKGQKLLFDEQPSKLNLMSEYTLFDQILILILLNMDLKALKKQPLTKSLETLLTKEIDNRLKKAAQLSQPEIMGLLLPLQKEFSDILPSCNLARDLLKRKTSPLPHLEDSHAILVYEKIFEKDLLNILIKDIKRRVKKANEKEKVFLEFNLLVMNHISGKGRGLYEFEDIIEEAGDHRKEELRTLARRLSRHTSGRLRDALESFEFDKPASPFFGSPFDNPFGSPFDAFFDDDDFDDDDDDDYDLFDDFKEMLADATDDKDLLKSLTESGGVDNIIDEIEFMVDEYGLRGLPKNVILTMRNLMFKKPDFRIGIEPMKPLVENLKIKNRLSREAILLIFGK